MADVMQFDLVSPERMLVSTEAERVQVPGMEGDMTALPNHSPLMTTLRPGVVSVHAGGGVEDFVVTGGFAEISPAGTSILAEEALPKADVTREWLDAKMKEVEGEIEIAEGDAKIAAGMRLNDLKQVGAALGL
ncbi:F0F1 ATP synthase subunit epsilon [Rhodovulum sp. DZ06]|uniref:F0F1 ATP synthase subunit epsilon n=1 Tax=Rhodovulum sp. DZ06 TaxID=3425126 RepID=UPI003D33E259